MTGFPGHPRPRKPDQPGGTPRRSKTEAPTPRPSSEPKRSSLDERIAEGVSAYPNNITFHELVARNKRHSVWLIAAMIAFAVLLGAVMGGALGPFFSGAVDVGGALNATYNDPAGTTASQASAERVADGASRGALRLSGLDLSAYGEWQTIAPGAAIGAAVMAVLAVIGSLWSFYGGANAVLRMSRAHPITKELDAELFNVTEEMSIAAGIPMPKLYLVGDSALNAFATGRDPEHGSVAITVGLRQKLSRDELQAVIAHEIAHIRHYDIRFGTLMATLVGIIVVACDAFLHGSWRVALLGGMSAGRGSSRGKGGAGPAAIVLLVLAIVLAIIAPFVARLIQMTYSRQREYLADAGAVELTRNPGAMASALRKLANDPDPLVDTANRGVAHMYIVNPLKKMHDSHQALDSLFCSHPPLAKRISRLLALLK